MVKAHDKTHRHGKKLNSPSQNRVTEKEGIGTDENQNPGNTSRGIYLSQSLSVFSKLRHEEPKPACRRSPVSTTMFTRLGERNKYVFTRLGDRKKDIHSRLGPEAVSCRRHANERISASTGRSVEDPSHRKKEARNLIRSYVTCSSERQREIEREWDALDRANRKQPTKIEETYLFEREVAVANQSRKKAPSTWKHHETPHKPSFDKRLDFKNRQKSNRRHAGNQGMPENGKSSDKATASKDAEGSAKPQRKPGKPE
nr:hypothetical protein [Tanacetum cinerariifolium]